MTTACGIHAVRLIKLTNFYPFRNELCLVSTLNISVRDLWGCMLRLGKVTHRLSLGFKGCICLF